MNAAHQKRVIVMAIQKKHVPNCGRMMIGVLGFCIYNLQAFTSPSLSCSVAFTLHKGAGAAAAAAEEEEEEEEETG